ncbi:MAG TPA: cytochrome c biogenesis protein CcsA [Bacteroidota bacterium]|nr:cytochrome c biogenesis protein CcsA [Bacteroidota bacterium]
MVGSLLVNVAFVTCLACIISYAVYRKRRSQNLLIAGRALYLVTVVTIVATAGYFLSLILSHQFQYTYVWSYSSKELSTPLLMSTFYAGQEGSFMLWTLYTSFFGILLLRNSSKNGYEPEVMGVYGLILLSLIVMITVKSPFKLVWESFPGQIAAGFAPADGRGLNPLLQNYWMVIHPQVMFSGFAAMGVPYAYVVASLIRRDYRNWVKPATPWLVVGCLILGTAIMMGGFWAYETLGWGGYWGWDPVENSSLVPWLFGVAGLHTILTHRKTGRFLRTSLVLTLFAFLMVVYSTFLTRSGVLGDTSVHSFVDPGMLVYWLLVAMIVVFFGLAAAMLIMRWKELPRPQTQHSYLSREFALFLGALTIVATAILVTVGTSSPLITDILYGKKSAVDTSYYSTTAIPLGIIIGLLAGIGQLLWWSRSNRREFLKSLLVPAAFGLVASIAIAWIAGAELIVGVFLFAAVFALVANIQVGWRIVKGNPKFAGGAVAHIGLAIMFLGFATSSKFQNKETVSLEQNKPRKVLGYTLTYVGYDSIGNDKYAFHVLGSKDGQTFTVSPVMYYSKYNDGLMRNPDIRNLYSHDFYLAPLSLEQPSSVTNAGVTTTTLKLGEEKAIGSIKVKFVDFDFPENQREAMLEGQDVQIGARLMVTGKGTGPEQIVPKKTIKKGQMDDEPATYENAYEFALGQLRPDQDNRENSTIELSIKDLAVSRAAEQAAAGQGDILVVEATVKPFINLVWSGLIILLVGFCVTIYRRFQESRSPVTQKEVVETPDAGVEEAIILDEPAH